MSRYIHYSIMSALDKLVREELLTSGLNDPVFARYAAAKIGSDRITAWHVWSLRQTLGIPSLRSRNAEAKRQEREARAAARVAAAAAAPTSADTTAVLSILAAFEARQNEQHEQIVVLMTKQIEVKNALDRVVADLKANTASISGLSRAVFPLRAIGELISAAPLQSPHVNPSNGNA